MTALCPLRYSLWIAAMLTSACAIEPLPEFAPPLGETFFQDASPGSGNLSVTRQGRYTLVELAPEAAQRDLLRQLVEISIPPTVEADLGDALRHVLRHSGYRLCEAPDDALGTLPLPAAHRHLGPMTLRDALLTLAGPAWSLSVDEVSRVVCFTRASGLPARPPGAPAAESGRARP